MAEDKKDEKKTTRKRTIPMSQNLEHGKLQPQATDLEEALLGAAMLENDVLINVIDIVSEDSFYMEAHQKIWKAILQLYNESSPVDILTVTDKIKSNGDFGDIISPYYVTQLTNRVSSGANSEYHARIIEQKKLGRDVIKIASELMSGAYDDTRDIFELIDMMITEAYNLNDLGGIKSSESNVELVKQVTKKIEHAKQEQGITGLKSGLIKQDLSFGGYKPTNFYVKAGRPAMGKTSLALCEANHMANNEGYKVIFFSIEMSSVQLMERMVSIQTDISLNKFASGEMTKDDWKQYHSKTSDLMNENLRIVDIAGITLNQVRKISKKHAVKHGLDCIFIDYLQLMRDPIKGQNSRQEEVSRISVGLKRLAKEMNVPVIALSQLSRAVETRGGDKRPQLSDLRESGSIEQDADVVQFVYRPEYYGITEDEAGNSTAGRADLINAKNRHGAVGDIHVKFIAHLTKFTDLNTEDIQPAAFKNLPIGENFDNEGSNFSHVPTSSQERKEMEDNEDDDLPF